MELLAWLEGRFPAPRWGETWRNGDLTHALFVECGVNVQIEGALYQLKYEMTVLDQWSVVCQQCRGIVVEREPHGWRIASLPFFKFFNQNEPECPISDARKFEALASELSFVEKADGTGIQLWFCGDETLERHLQIMQAAAEADGHTANKKVRDEDEHARIVAKLKEGVDAAAPGRANSEAILTPDERRALMYHRNKKTGLSDGVRVPRMCDGWRISTFGRITPAKVLERLFWSLFGASAEKLSLLDRSTTYLFEMCGKENKVVTDYDFDRLYLIGGRRAARLRAFEMGWSASVDDVLTPVELDALCEKLDNKLILRPFVETSHPASLAEALRFVDAQSRRTDLGSTPEGFVLSYRGVPIAKMKNQRYLSKHGLLTGPLLYCRGIVIERFFEGTLDDVDDCLSDPLRRFVAELKGKVKETTSAAFALWKSGLAPALREAGPMLTPGQTAQIINRFDKKFAPFFFRTAAKLLDGDAEFDSLFLAWLKASYMLKQWRPYFTQTMIEEFVLQEKLNSGQMRLVMANDKAADDNNTVSNANNVSNSNNT